MWLILNHYILYKHIMSMAKGSHHTVECCQWYTVQYDWLSCLWIQPDLELDNDQDYDFMLGLDQTLITSKLTQMSLTRPEAVIASKWVRFTIVFNTGISKKDQMVSTMDISNLGCNITKSRARQVFKGLLFRPQSTVWHLTHTLNDGVTLNRKSYNIQHA